MKVGIYFPGFPPEAGGGFTFEKGLLDAFMELVHKSHHSYTLFFDNVKDSEVFHIQLPVSAKNWKAVPISRNAPFVAKKGFGERIVRRLGFHLQPPAVKVDPFHQALGFENIECLWFPTPNAFHTNIPYIATVWDIQHRLQPWFPEVGKDGVWEAREVFYSSYLRRAIYIITPNQTGKKELSFFYQIPANRFKVLPHPVPQIDTLPSNEEVEKILKKYNLMKGYIFFPAQFWSHKNHANLLYALKVLRDDHDLAFNLVLVGSNTGNLEYIKQLAEDLGIEKQIHYLGYVARDELLAFYCGAFSLVYISLFGPENLPPLEAFMCRCPVIASDVDGAEEQLGDAAHLVKGTSATEIALAIKKLHDEPMYRESLIKKGIARKNYTNQEYMQEVFNMFDEFSFIRRNWK